MSVGPLGTVRATRVDGFKFRQGREGCRLVCRGYRNERRTVPLSHTSILNDSWMTHDPLLICEMYTIDHYKLGVLQG